MSGSMYHNWKYARLRRKILEIAIYRYQHSPQYWYWMEHYDRLGVLCDKMDGYYSGS